MKAAVLVTRVLRLLRVIDVNDAPGAEDARDVLYVLEGLLAEWRGSDIMVPDYQVKGVNDDLTIDEADREAVAYQVALRMSPEYGASLTPETRAALDESFNRFRLRYFQPGDADLSELPRARGAHRAYNIDND